MNFHTAPSFSCLLNFKLGLLCFIFCCGCNFKGKRFGNRALQKFPNIFASSEGVELSGLGGPLYKLPGGNNDQCKYLPSGLKKF
jgi:hypothetical protein